MKRRRRDRSRADWTVLALEVAAALAIFAAHSARLDTAWIEHGYANGIYAALNRAAVPFANGFPFALGDLLWFGLPLAVVAGWVMALRRARGGRARTLARLAGHTLLLGAVVLGAFDLSWALNYRRATVAERVAFDRTRVTDAAVAAYARRVVEGLNATAPLAHRQLAFTDAQITVLRFAFLPVARRLGDDWDVVVTRPKTTLVNAYFEAAGIGGMYDPLAFETLLNASFLPWETPRALAHEWAHAAGFADEGDANYIGTVACLRSTDPLVRYSGWFWSYAELPADLRARYPVTALVRADMAASQQRFLRNYRPQLFAISWRLYDRYLTSYHVAGGVRSYGRFLELLVGVPLDDLGLPAVHLNKP